AFVVEHDQELLMAQGQRLRFGMPAVEDCRYFSVVTQAAARTFALRLAELGNEFERGFHNLLQLHHKLKRPSTATNCKGADLNLINIERTHRLLVANAANRLGQQSRDAQLTDLFARGARLRQ